ncbi:DUF2062 domain-containing protein [Rhizobium sp. 1AS11]|nr:DUF2062 domain-containing protein [Rhizobium acaciae]MCW1746237.1 DUF2062 domain-containing protein [Rhizobium acaciae]
MIAAALGTAFGNPLTFPLTFAAAYRIGIFLLGRAGSLCRRSPGEVALCTASGNGKLDADDRCGASVWHRLHNESLYRSSRFR